MKASGAKRRKVGAQTLDMALIVAIWPDAPALKPPVDEEVAPRRLALSELSVSRRFASAVPIPLRDCDSSVPVGDGQRGADDALGAREHFGEGGQLREVLRLEA